MGTPDFAVPSLYALAEVCNVMAVVTQPDRRRGRGHQLLASPVKKAALALKLPVYQPNDVNHDSNILSLNVDYFVVVAYGQILRSHILSAPRYCINLHASLLPKYRGAAPIHRAIEQGEAISGICTMKMAKGLDTGDVIACKKYSLENQTSEQIHDLFAVEGAALLVDTIKQLENGTAIFHPQDDLQATYAHKISKSDYRWQAHWTTQEFIHKLLAYGFVNYYDDVTGDLYKIFEIFTEKPTPWPIQTADGTVYVKTLQAPNAKKMSIDAYMRGHIR